MKPKYKLRDKRPEKPEKPYKPRKIYILPKDRIERRFRLPGSLNFEEKRRSLGRCSLKNMKFLFLVTNFKKYLTGVIFFVIL